MARPGDIVLLAGKGHEPTLATAHGPEEWNEAEIAREALRELGFGR
jgi:UDP-N-acetylmuramoyl-L-alanyl-D-glutamate--2,6-diaminopimelate ligase